MNNGLMRQEGLHDRQDGGCQLLTSAREADIVGHQSDVSPPTFSVQFFRRLDQCGPPTSVQLADIQASVGRRQCGPAGPTSEAGRRPAVSAKLDRQCWRPTLADTQADTQSVTLVMRSTLSWESIG